MLKLKRISVFTLITLLMFGLTFIPAKPTEAASLQRILKVGCTGSDVADVQKMLSSLGVNVGPIDGVFGQKTKQGIIVFQDYNNLIVDGIVGQQTYSALLLHTGKDSSNRTAASTTVSRGGSRPDSREIQLLAQLISSEAKGEPYEGQVAVGAVILNRVNSPKFPNSIAGVVYEKGQFEPVMNGTIYQNPSQSAIKAAQDAINGWDPSYGALYFYNPIKSSSSWIFSRPIITKIGNHIFAK